MVNRYKYIDESRKHLHTLDGKALIGASTAKGIIGDKGNLLQWYADNAAVSALAFPAQDIKAEYEACKAIADKIERAKASQELDKKYPNYAIARRAANTSRDKSAKTGTARHSSLEDYIRMCIVENQGKPRGVLASEYSSDVLNFINWAFTNVDVFLFTEANCYHEGLWVGGIADLGLRLNNGKRFVCDHKSSKEAYPDQFLQCAIYDVLLSHSGGLDADGNKLFDWEPADGYIVFPFRSDPFTPEYRYNVEQFRKGVDATVHLYKLFELQS